MNAVWTIILFSGLSAMLLSDPDGALTAMLTGASSAVELSLSLLATYGFWLGLFSLIEHTGLSNKLSRILRPVVRKLFPGIKEDTEKYITMNISANLLGLGSSSTLMGINAVKSMDVGSDRATDSMIMLVVISSTSLQLIPTTVLGLRIAHGSLAPTAFLFPCMAATTLSTALGILSVKLISALGKRLTGGRSSEKKHEPAPLPLSESLK